MSLQFFPEPLPDEKEVRTKTAEFVDRYLRPTAIEDDVNCRFRREYFDALAKLKLHCVAQPTKYGGGGLSHRCFYACLEELARGSLAFSVSVGVTNLVQGAINAFGTDKQKEEFLRPLTEGKWLGAFSLSEPHSGSDAASLSLNAKSVKDGYQLNGTKIWCSNAGHADLYLVMARTSEPKFKGITSFLVPKDTPGFRIGKQEKKLGLRASTLAELIFEDCFIPTNQCLGDEGKGFMVALSQLDSGRISIGAAGVAAAVETLERAWRHLKKWPKDAAVSPEGIQQILAEHYAHSQAVRCLIREAATQKDLGKPITVLASAVKLLGSDLAVRVAGNAVEFMGEAGYTREFEVERYFRDAKALQIVEGTNQIQKLVLAREIDAMIPG